MLRRLVRKHLRTSPGPDTSISLLGRSDAILCMSVVLLSLLLLLQLPVSFASRVMITSRVCGNDHIAYSSFLGNQLFYVNGNLVDKDSFCKVLKFHPVNSCILDGNIGGDNFKTECSSVELPSNAGRKLLENVVEEGSSKPNSGQEIHAGGGKQAQKPCLTPKGIAAASSGVLLICCALLCPCLQARRKATGHTVMSKEPNSTESGPAFERSSPPEKVPASPRVPPSPSRISMSPKLNRIGSVHLTMGQVAKATQNFSQALQIGEGGFGTVYKAQLTDGQIVAVKRAKREHFETLRTEFSSEVDLLAKIDHRNLVKLLGYVEKGNERLIITEYVPNGTLREHLDGLRGKILDFNQRLEISIDVAHALTYLHLYAEKQIIHRDVKSSNILLTESLRAKAFDKFNEGNVVVLVDPLMEESVDTAILVKMFSLAFQCSAPVRTDRPDMKTVGQQLWAIRMDYLKSVKRG
ncbi:Serine-threonine/tyrosine-protein kinase, catalytic domain [Dillenia turbinata]|uniref:Serine-threonine/tyrosine-protein kinase, catalytic domain n=1 Tax=Dillenia turbinata TaxID=194707 RepID=A0AAN8W4F9_9MAGN